MHHQNTYKYIIDFHGASHGNFLEYVINTWIYNGPKISKVFTDLGTCHLPRYDLDYLKHRMIKCEHYTEKQYNPIHSPEKIVRITVSTRLEKQIHMINLMHRPGDITLENSYKAIPPTVVNSPALLRNDWFGKLTDVTNSYKLDYEWRWPDVGAFEFPFECFYDLTKFYKTLQRCADFLEQKFVPDQVLYATWHEFIKMNQGAQCYAKSKKIVELALGNQDFDFDSNEYEQAFINVILGDTANICSGSLFTDSQYPTNTKQIWQCIQQHLDNFDSKF